MEKPPNTAEDITNKEQNETNNTSVSIESTPETQKTTEILSKITENIQDGEGLTKEDLTNLKESLTDIPIQLGPYSFPARRLLELSEEDLKEQAEILTKISKDDFDNLNNLKLINPKVSKQLEKVNGTLDLESLTSTEGLKLPETIGGGLYLNSLTSAEGLKLPETIGGLILSSLTSAEGLKLPETVGGLILSSLPEPEKQKLREQRPDLADKI